MRNLIGSFLGFIFVTTSLFAQSTTVEKGSYLSTNDGQKIKLNLLDNNKYELVFFSGDYEVKNDSLVFTSDAKSNGVFDVDFSDVKTSNSDKIKVSFFEGPYDGFYIGTQNAAEPVEYKRFSDVVEVSLDTTQSASSFEIDHSKFLYLVYENYYGLCKMSKFEVPKTATTITIRYRPNILDNLKIKGFFDKEKKELVVAEMKGKNPIVFQQEAAVAQLAASKIIPVENVSLTNWTYPGKNSSVLAEPDAVLVDSAAVSYEAPKVDFKLKVEKSFSKALKATQKKDNKFLVLYKDTNQVSSRTNFETFIKEQEVQVSNNFYEAYDSKYDRFNYYLVSKKDKNELKNYKIEAAPSITILDGNGAVLAKAKSNLADKATQFHYYYAFYTQLERVSALSNLKKLIDLNKAKDADLIKALNRISSLEIPYGVESDSTTVVLDGEFDFTKVTLDKNKLQSAWENLIQAHEKDTEPNMALVEVVLKEINNKGFNKQLFGEEKAFNNADFNAMDYLIKHHKAIDSGRSQYIEQASEGHELGDLSTEISYALAQNSGLEVADSGEDYEEKIISIYKKLIAVEGTFDCYRNYFDYLRVYTETDDRENLFLKEFDAYFNKFLAHEGSIIESLDEVYTSTGAKQGYSMSWTEFKDYHTNLCNETAWSVVLKSASPEFVKKAIHWSELSLKIQKNNAYYLDTLAQLYYKDGQKEKGIATQEAAVRFSENIEQETKAEIQETLIKMKNGTY
jgi:hypothetical protein